LFNTPFYFLACRQQHRPLLHLLITFSSFLICTSSCTYFAPASYAPDTFAQSALCPVAIFTAATVAPASSGPVSSAKMRNVELVFCCHPHTNRLHRRRIYLSIISI
jgi:hypothetical protein